jgi:predicted anti-sigma-YlaC factor YlaD
VRCDYAHDDGAYVLGALSPAERSAYERHLSTCPACREAVAEIAVLPGLLGRLDSSMALQLLGEDRPADGADQTATPRASASRESDGEARVVSLVAAAAQRRRREQRGRRLRYAGSVLAAACLALVVALGVGVLRDTGGGTGPGIVDPGEPPAAHLEAMKPRSPNGERITALVGVTGHEWGTEITMDCSYPTPASGTLPSPAAWQVRLVAVGPDNETDQVGSWIAAPGKRITFEGATRFSKDQLMRLELQGANGTTLMSYDVT